jgi:hypothetical protein
MSRFESGVSDDNDKTYCTIGSSMNISRQDIVYCSVLACACERQGGCGRLLVKIHNKFQSFWERNARKKNAQRRCFMRTQEKQVEATTGNNVRACVDG